MYLKYCWADKKIYTILKMEEIMVANFLIQTQNTW